MDPLLASIWLSVPASVMIYAAYRDAVSREVPDRCWLVICAWGVLFQIAFPTGDPTASALVALGSLALTAFMLSERLSGIRAVPVLALSALMYVSAWMSDPWGEAAVSGLMVPVTFALAYLMYQTGMLAGGADAKCVMSLAIAFPVLPESSWTPVLWNQAYPEAYVLNPAISVLIVALLLSLLWGAWMFLHNARRGEWGRGMFHTLRMPIEEARVAFVWPAEWLSEDGAVVPGRRADTEKDETLDRLEGAGMRDVRVTPMIPFIVPMAVSFLIVTVLGDPLMAVI